MEKEKEFLGLIETVTDEFSLDSDKASILSASFNNDREYTLSFHNEGELYQITYQNAEGKQLIPKNEKLFDVIKEPSEFERLVLNKDISVLSIENEITELQDKAINLINKPIGTSIEIEKNFEMAMDSHDLISTQKGLVAVSKPCQELLNQQTEIVEAIHLYTTEMDNILNIPEFADDLNYRDIELFVDEMRHISHVTHIAMDHSIELNKAIQSAKQENLEMMRHTWHLKEYLHDPKNFNTLTASEKVVLSANREHPFKKGFEEEFQTIKSSITQKEAITFVLKEQISHPAEKIEERLSNLQSIQSYLAEDPFNAFSRNLTSVDRLQSLSNQAIDSAIKELNKELKNTLEQTPELTKGAAIDNSKAQSLILPATNCKGAIDVFQMVELAKHYAPLVEQYWKDSALQTISEYVNSPEGKPYNMVSLSSIHKSLKKSEQTLDVKNRLSQVEQTIDSIKQTINQKPFLFDGKKEMAQAAVHFLNEQFEKSHEKMKEQPKQEFQLEQ
ncbi:hypothetical protein [Bacillus sp. 1P06AnD]|uniref:hypothetical protein n=1 Tax=Bacillus sp. 1P06AnD TaxID=3132208 RepID=UPI0039A1762D